MSGRRRQSLSPSLFPFLAVLVCTLGTLILLLALVAQNSATTARQIAETAASEAKPSGDALTVGQVNDLVEEEAFRLEKLVSFRDAQTNDLERRRDELAHVEDHMRRIHLRLKEIADAMKKARDETIEGVDADELERLQKELADKESTVKRLREEVQTEKPRFVIVPHQGPNGTGRRPIYLECHERGITIWPEGIELSQWQLEQSSTQANPLDDALRAARYHALNHYGDEKPPYPMLLVRPDGVEAYYAARAAMTEWEDQFGYELVPDAVELAYPKSDPALKQKMLYAIKAATDRQQQYSFARAGQGSHSSSNQRYPGNGILPENISQANSRSTGDGGNRSLAGSGYESPQQAAQPTPPKRVPKLSVAEMDRRGRSSGFRDHRSLPMRSYGYGSSSGNQSITADDAKRRLERMMDDGANSYAADSQTGKNDASGEPERGMSMPDPGAATQQGADDFDLAIDESNSQTQPSQQQLDLFAPGAMLLPDATDQTQQSGQAGYSDTAARQMKNKEATTTEGGATFSIGQMGSMGPNNNTQSNPTQAAEVSAKSPDANNPMPQSATAQNDSPTPQRRLVQRSGVDWALPSSVSLGRGNEIIRHVKLMVYPDRYVLPAARGAARTETFMMSTNGFNQASLEMATAVRDRIDQWGATAPGSRWSPRLQVVVMPGAESQFNQLNRLMIGSGLPIEVDASSQAKSGATNTPLGGGLR
ncbi:hypothetical protein LOC67_03795 [Stieleria sp. JC731]|uniref:hypothetical protein n=1 Tax=Pirellulaceae TaxID=2691357 RepID=UPI001E3A0E39|nr:hypothetical protein [Stieleria sp. JC731]MCC9599673.1 hypothetical protein [Stieleria sp. JC731]